MPSELGLGERLSVLARLAEAMLSVKPHGWLGRTHIQKAVFFAQELLDIDLGYEFTIYQYGPYAASLDSDLSHLITMNALQVHRVGGYPDYDRGSNIGPLLTYFQHTPLANVEESLNRVANIVAPKKARELELLTTILYLGRRGHAGDDLIQTTRRLKPHFDEEQVKQGVRDLQAVAQSLTAQRHAS